MKPSGIAINGPALAEIRRQAGLSKSAAAKLAGISHATWSQYEGNTRGASTAALEQICKALNIEDERAIRADVLAELVADMDRNRSRRNRPVAA